MFNVLKLLMLVVGLFLFLVLWNGVVKIIDILLGQFFGLVQVWEQFMMFIDEYFVQCEKVDVFYVCQEECNVVWIVKDLSYEFKICLFIGVFIFFDQIWISLYIVMVGFVIVSIVVVFVGILCGLSCFVYLVMNFLI